MVLTFWSCATGIREPCQAGNRAALSEPSCVPRGCWDRAGCKGNVYDTFSTQNVRIIYNGRDAVFLFFNRLDDNNPGWGLPGGSNSLLVSPYKFCYN